DPETRHTRKSQHNRTDGYRAHLVAEPETGLITDERLTMAAGADNADAAVAHQFVAHRQPAAPSQAAQGQAARDERGGVDDPREDVADAATTAAPNTGGPGQDLSWYGDSAYGTGELREAIDQAGHRAVIKPRPVQPAVDGGFTVDDFTVDEQAGTVTCPAGQTRPISARRTVSFRALCPNCP